MTREFTHWELQKNDSYVYYLNKTMRIRVSHKNVFFQRFRFIYYSIKYKSRIMAWMWRAREQIAIREWHPDRLRERIAAAGGDLDCLFY